MTRIVELADGSSSATAPTTTAVPTTADVVTFDPTGTDFVSTDLQALGEETDDRLVALENANFDNFLGYWNANTNTPTLSNGGGGGIVEGQYYVVSTAGTTSLDGISDWGVGDEVFFDGTVWKKRDNSDLVLSVAGKTGVVTLDANDVSETTSKFWAKKLNVSTSAPTASDDNTAGYSIGSKWFRTTTQRLYVASSVGTGTATWVLVEGSVTSVNGATGTVVLGANDIAPSTTRYWSLKNNLTATVAPTVNDDGTLNYAAGSQWYNQTTDIFYVCESSSTGAAVWTAVQGASPAAIKVATLKDVKASGTDGGTFTSGAFQTRVLNTLEGDNTIVSLSANQFTLTTGKYIIEAFAPATAAGVTGIAQNKAKIRNITDSTDALIGESSNCQATGVVVSSCTSYVIGTIDVVGSKTFELQHRCTTTVATNGFGSASSFGVSEIYSIVNITKVS